MSRPSDAAASYWGAPYCGQVRCVYVMCECECVCVSVCMCECVCDV